MIWSAFPFAVVVLSTAAAGWGIARRTLGAAIDAEHRLLAGALCGWALVAAGTAAGALAGHAAAGAAVALAGGLACLSGGGPGELREALRVSGRRWLLWIAAAVVWTLLLHVRQIEFGPDRVAWRGTLGWETWFHTELTRSVAGDPPFHWREPDLPGRIQYHCGVHLLAAGWTALSGTDVVTMFARLLPPVLFAVAFESHRSLLRAWLPGGAAVCVAALLPAVVTDLRPWLQVLGVDPVPGFDHLLANSFNASPSFVAGQAFAAFALGRAISAAREGRLDVRAGAALGVLLGTIVVWKLPSFVIAAPAFAALAPWLAARAGWRTAAWSAVAAAATALVLTAAAFPALLGIPGERARTLAAQSQWAPLHQFAPASSGLSGTGAAAVLAGLWLLHGLGPRAFALPGLVRAVREDRSWLAIFVPLVLGLALPLLVQVGEDEEKYLLRCGAMGALLVTGSWAVRDLACGRRAALVPAAVIVLSCAWTARPIVVPKGMDAVIGAGELRALGSLRGMVVVSPSVSRRLAWAAGAWTDARLVRPESPDAAGARSRIDLAGAAPREDERVLAAGSAVTVFTRD